MVSEMKEIVVPTEIDRQRALALEALGFDAFDAAHLACAEKAKVDVFLTTDDPLLRMASRFKNKLQVKVDNPLKWFEEMVKQ